MRRTHYRVGFLGTTAAGKSTTVNNLLQVTEADAPAKSGGGPATTAAPSRIRKSPDSKHHITLRYMSQVDYDKRRNDMAQHLGFGINETSEELVLKCRDLERQIDTGGLVRQKKEDLVALRVLIQSAEEFPHLISSNSQRLGEPGDFELRDKYLNHPFDPKNPNAPVMPSKNRLLWEAEIDLANQVLPNTLEMVDLPGLGAGKHHDTCVTMDVIQNEKGDGLDGALVFLNAGRLSNEEVQNLVIELLQNWKRKAKDRVWLIITQYDALTDAQIGRGGIWFHGIDLVMKRMEISPECCYVVSNKVADKLKPSMTEEERIKEATLRLDSRAFEDPTLQEHMTTHPQFVEIIREVYRSGGLGRLREHLVSRLARNIAQEVGEDARLLVSRANASLARLKSSFEKMKKQNPEDRRKAITCAQKVNGVIEHCRKGMPELKAATRELADGLYRTVRENSPVANIRQINPKQIPEVFRHLADMLDNDFPQIVEKGCEPVFKRISEELAQLPAVAVPNADSVTAAWESARNAAVESQTAAANKPKFQDADLISRLTTRADQMQSREFNDLLDEKIRAVTIETMHMVRARLIDDLNKIHGDLMLLMKAK